MQVEIKRLHPDAILPKYAHEHDAGMDLCSSETVEILPGEWVKVGTGIAIAIPEGYEGQVRPRSGLALNNGITVLNAPGTIDAGFRGEIGVILFNCSQEPFKVVPTMKIAQMVFQRIEYAELVEVKELGTSDRGLGGFGSTGV